MEYFRSKYFHKWLLSKIPSTQNTSRINFHELLIEHLINTTPTETCENVRN